MSCGGGGNPVVPSSDNTSNIQDSGGSEFSPEQDSTGEPFKMDDTWHPDDGPDYAQDEVLITFHDGFIQYETDGQMTLDSAQNGLDLLTSHGLEIIKILELSWGTLYQLKITDGIPVQDKVNELKSVQEIDIAEPNYRMHLQDSPWVPNDPLWENPNDSDDDPRTNVWEQFGPSKIGASYIWENVTGEGQVVCILDTGVQTWHEDLADNLWINEGEIPDDGIDNDENGYIDDIYGWDVGDNDNDIKEYNNNYNYHGTACAGVVAAIRDNNLGCTGIAPGSKVMGVRLRFTATFVTQVIEGVEYAKNNGADIVSMSFISSDYSESMENTMIAADAAGVLLVAGAGNYDATYILYPCSFDSVVKVGATSPFSQKWAYNPIDEVRISIAAGFGWGSTYANGLEIMGYGEHYITTKGNCASCYWDGVNDNFFGGTSNATPMVAAAYALLRSYFPGETNDWYRDRMNGTADDLHGAGYDIETANGRINVLRAIYGADRYALEEDADGFVDLGPHGLEVFDSVNNALSGDYIDQSDLYKITTGTSGYQVVILNIFTYGENLDIKLFSHPSLAPEFLLDEAVGENHANDNKEIIGTACEAGETFYIQVNAVAPGDASSYDLTAKIVQNDFDLVDHGSIDPGFIHVGKNNVLVGYLTFESGFRVYLEELILSMSGSMPPSNLTGMHLYRDIDGDHNFDSGEELIANANDNGTNRWRFSGFSHEINMTNSPMSYFITADISGVTENAEFSLVLTSYKDASTEEGLEIPYTKFPVEIGPVVVGVDVDPPTWNSTVGAQLAEPQYAAAMIYWNAASDVLTPPVKYNVYWTQTLPFDFGSADVAWNVNDSGSTDFDSEWKLTGLNNDEEYYIAVRAEDQAGNEEENTVYVTATPSAASDPTNPQVIGIRNTPGSSWEVVCDPANQRVFVADYQGGVRIIDVSDPTNPTNVDSVAGSGVAGVDFDGTYVYAASAIGLLIIDPDFAGGAAIVSQVFFYNALDVQLAGNWVYVTDRGTELMPVDITDPLTPIEYPSVSSGDIGYGIDEQNGYLYVATNTKPRVFDLTDPSAPVMVSTFGGNGAYEIDAIDDLLYVTYWSQHRFSIYDLSDPADPQYINQYISDAGYYGADVEMFNGYLYFGTNSRDIEVLNVDDPLNIFKLGEIQTDGPDGLGTDGSFVYSAENQHGLKVII